MKWIKATFALMCVFALAGCMNPNVALIQQEVPSELSVLTGLAQSIEFDQTGGSEPACEATWQWPSRFGDIRFQECEHGGRYFVELTQQVVDAQVNLSTVSWSWHNCTDSRVQLGGSANQFITNPPHLSTCRDRGYYLLLEYQNGQAERFWDSVWFRPGIYLK